MKVWRATACLWLLLAVLSSAVLCCLEHFTCTFGQQKTEVWCDDEQIDSVPLCLNPSLVSLALHSTRVHTLYVTSFRYYAKLNFVDLSNNRIATVENKTFEYQRHLEELRLDHNRIANIHKLTFIGLSKLHVLLLSYNLLEDIPPHTFEFAPFLQHLDLSHNRITTIGEGALAGIGSLAILGLAQNRLPFAPSDALKKLPHLAELSIGGNVFTSIDKGSFQFVSELTTLDLSSTNLSVGIKAEVFEDISGLRSLFLNDCQLLAVPVEALTAFPKLEILHLSRNHFTELPQKAFKTNTRLHELVVTGCPRLKRVVSGSLRDNLDLEQVDLSRNSILAFLPHEDFRFLTQLSFLDLHGNGLEYIPRDAAAWGDISVWRIHDNPISCNCSVAWLRETLLTTQTNNLSALPLDVIRCATPPKLRGTAVVATKLEDLACSMNSTTRSGVIAGAVCGALLVLACLILFFLYRHHESCVQRLLKRQKWGGEVRSRTPTHRFSSNSEYPYIKPVPVTEL